MLAALARAIAWLARAGVIYTDLRAPNVLVDAGGSPGWWTLMTVLQRLRQWGSVEGYLAAVAASAGAAQEGTFAASLGAGGEGVVVEALRVAFEAGGGGRGGGGAARGGG